MKKLFGVSALIASFILTGAAFAQHRNPDSQPSNPPPQHAQPKDSGTAKPRQAPPRPRGTPRSGGRVVVVPYAGWPWWGYPPRAYPPYGFGVYTEWESSNVRLDVEPEDAQVYIDNYYAGIVDDFNGFFQRVTLHAGPHLIDIRKPGYRSLVVELNLYPGQTVTYRGKMEKSLDGADPRASNVPLAPGYEEGAELPPMDAPPGDVKLDVSPKDASVFADGFYVGLVDDFNGGQHLRLTIGAHHLVISKEGYETLETDLAVTSEDTMTFRATLKKS